MHTTHIKLSRPWAVAALVLVAFAGLGVKATLKSSAEGPAEPSQQQEGRGPVQNVHFVLYDAGIHPREARARAGRVILRLEDKSGGASELVIERVIGQGRERLGQVRRSTALPRGKAELRLVPGRYVVYDSARPSHSSTLTVEP